MLALLQPAARASFISRLCTLCTLLTRASHVLCARRPFMQFFNRTLSSLVMLLNPMAAAGLISRWMQKERAQSIQVRPRTTIERMPTVAFMVPRRRVDLIVRPRLYTSQVAAMLEGRAWVVFYALPLTQGCAAGREAAATFVCVHASPSMWLWRRACLKKLSCSCVHALFSSLRLPPEG